MPALYLKDVPSEVYERLQRLAAARNSTVEAEALAALLLGLPPEPSRRSQAELLEEMRRRSFTPPPGTPDSVELLREDRELLSP